MKCDELKPIHVPAEMCGEITLVEAFDYYDRKPVDEAIAELKAENERLKKELWEADERAIDAGATSVEKMEETKSTRRALWLARAERAKTTAKIYSQEASLILLKEHYPKSCGFCYIMNNKWKKVEQLCRAKAKDLK